MSKLDNERIVDLAQTPEPLGARAAYEPPRVTELGTLAELTHGGGGGGFDDGEIGST